MRTVGDSIGSLIAASGVILLSIFVWLAVFGAFVSETSPPPIPMWLLLGSVVVYILYSVVVQTSFWMFFDGIGEREARIAQGVSYLLGLVALSTVFIIL